MLRPRLAFPLGVVLFGSALFAASSCQTVRAQDGQLPEQPGRERPSRGPRMSGDHDYPPLDKVTEGYEKVVSTADGQQSPTPSGATAMDRCSRSCLP